MLASIILSSIGFRYSELSGTVTKILALSVVNDRFASLNSRCAGEPGVLNVSKQIEYEDKFVALTTKLALELRLNGKKVVLM
ncbi:hypothetical protein [Synechocystis sp. LKSZ1]|uniref:hypothetical protein n=1 Tax=Synechocystis sp. LKSZ1 TaxID=3144951 RepID=UPI00336BE014